MRHELTPELTFIVLARPPSAPAELAHLLAHCEMAGDVNLFLHQRYDDDDDDDDADDAARPTTWGELEIMIANPQVRRRGLAHEALRLFVHYVLTTSLGGVELPASRLFARVALENTPSLGLFTKLGFVQHSVSDVFQEAELRLGAAPPAAPPVSVLAWPETTGPSVPGPAHAPDQTPPPSQA